MQTAFTAPPAAFRAESPRSKVWTLALAIIVVFVALILCARFAPEWAAFWLVREPFGLLEMVGFALPLATSCLALRMLATRTVRSDWLLTIWMIAIALGSIYIAGEEISWGQWFWKWGTPEFWQGLNDQGETNLHNVSDWFDQKPRALLIIGIAVSGIIFPWFILNKPHLVMRRFDMLYPPLWLTPLAIAVLASDIFLHVDVPLIADEIGLLRPGEMQELFIVWFLFAYTLALWRRVKVLEGKA